MSKVKSLCIIILLLCYGGSYAQNYDLIVTTEGDSIACIIDSISEKTVHFEMKVQNNWIHTHFDKSQVSEYKFEAISKKSASFKAGNSYLESAKQISETRSYKNSIYLENLVNLPSISYDRFISTGEKTGIVLKIGISYYDNVLLVAESSFLVGKKRHFFEAGLGFGGNDSLGLFSRTGYRYKGKKGLLLKGGILIVKNVPVFPAFAVGFSF